MSKKLPFFTGTRKYFIFAFLLCLIFATAYSVLSVIRHVNYQSFGYDLGINNQVVWKYSTFQEPITTIDHVPFISKLDVHVEFIYMLLTPFYWIWGTARTLLILEAITVSFSGLAIFLISRKYNLHIWIQFALLFSYLMFYGVQNALWFDLHSVTFGTAFLAWFLYFLLNKKNLLSLVFFFLAITSKENIAAMTFLISVVYFISTRRKTGLYFAFLSSIYLLFIFGVYFPFIVEGGYRFKNPDGLFSQVNPLLMINTPEKRDVYLYTFLSYGFLPILSPLYLVPVVGNLVSYFVLGQSVSTAQGLFLHYRIELAPLMSWATIVTIAKFRWLNKKYTALYLIFCALFVQYLLHLPLSYLTKSWFWTQPSGVKHIEMIKENIPSNASIVSQNNIIPHISRRDAIFTLWPEKKTFTKDSPCGSELCDWFRWAGNPEYLIVDTSTEWDIRHLLTTREEYIQGLANLEKAGVVTRYKEEGTAVLYKVNTMP